MDHIPLSLENHAGLMAHMNAFDTKAKTDALKGREKGAWREQRRKGKKNLMSKYTFEFRR